MLKEMLELAVVVVLYDRGSVAACGLEELAFSQFVDRHVESGTECICCAELEFGLVWEGILG